MINTLAISYFINYDESYFFIRSEKTGNFIVVNDKDFYSIAPSYHCNSICIKNYFIKDIEVTEYYIDMDLETLKELELNRLNIHTLLNRQEDFLTTIKDLRSN